MSIITYSAQKQKNKKAKAKLWLFVYCLILVFSYEWQKAHDTSTLDSVSNLALVLSASTSDTTWQDFTSF